MTNFTARTYTIVSGKNTFLVSPSSLMSHNADKKNVYCNTSCLCLVSHHRCLRVRVLSILGEVCGSESWLWDRLDLVLAAICPTSCTGVFLLHSASCEVLISFHNALWQTHTTHAHTYTLTKGCPSTPLLTGCRITVLSWAACTSWILYFNDA